MEKEKFQFDTDFQESLLQYTVTDKNGHKALHLYEDTYFSLLSHQIIAKALKLYFKKKQKVPQSRVVLKEQLRKLLSTRDFINALTSEDKQEINKIVNKIYAKPAKDGDEILSECIKFAQFISLKDTIERIDLTDYTQYDIFSKQVRKSISIGNEFKEERGILLIEGIKDRQYKRRFNQDTIPTPYWQLNKLTNGGGYPKGSVIVLIGPEKEFKTGMLINIARGYLRTRKKVLIIDLENGQEALSIRLEQSLTNKSKRDILSGEFDQSVLKQFRKYHRLGGEIDIKRMPAYSTTCSDIQAYIDSQYNELGLTYHAIICDYVALMGSISGAKDDTQRISDAYVDFKNLVERNKFETGWTANHIQRGTEKRYPTRFLSSDTAKCIDIVRHVDVALGFNRSELDKQIGTARLEIIDQRDGPPNGFALFKVNYETQKAVEVSKADLKDYYEALKKVDSGIEHPKPDNDLMDG